MMKKDKKICFILCPPVWPNLPSLGIAYLTSFLNKNNYQVTILDLNIILYNHLSPELKAKWTISGESFEKYLFALFGKTFLNSVLNQLFSREITYIGFSVFKKNLAFSLALSKIIKNHFPHSRIIFGGPACTQLKFQKSKKWSDEIDYIEAIIIGEGEANLIKYLDRRPKIKNSSLPDIYEEKKSMALDDLPFPSFDAFPLPDYPRRKALPILTSRGCPNHCSFCSERLLYHGYRNRNPKKVVEEIEYQKERHQTKWFTFYDSLINAHLNALNELCDLLLKKNLMIKWDAQAIIRTDMTEELLAKMKEAGCFNLFIGLETGSDKILRIMNKPFTRKVAHGFFKKCFRKGPHFEVGLMVGFPEENETDFEETIDFLKENKAFIPKIAQVNPYIPYQGTVMYHEIQLRKKYEIDHSVQHRRVEKLLDLFHREGITYTQSYINNLIEPQ